MRTETVSTLLASSGAANMAATTAQKSVTALMGNSIAEQGQTLRNLGLPANTPAILEKLGVKLDAPAPPKSPATPNCNASEPSGIGGIIERTIAKILARFLVVPGGSGTQQDVVVVVAELEKMPASALMALVKNGTKVIACRNNVTDYDPSLKGVRPRGWPPGSSWDSVPGAYMGDKKAVVIATRGHGNAGGPYVPRTGDGHGSVNLVIHETAHAVDAATGGSASRAFNEARNKDINKLSDYERQPGAAGQSETFAESAARYYGGGNACNTPNLNDYWRRHPLGS